MSVGSHGPVIDLRLTLLQPRAYHADMRCSTSRYEFSALHHLAFTRHLVPVEHGPFHDDSDAYQARQTATLVYEHPTCLHYPRFANRQKPNAQALCPDPLIEDPQCETEKPRKRGMYGKYPLCFCSASRTSDRRTPGYRYTIDRAVIQGEGVGGRCCDI